MTDITEEQFDREAKEIEKQRQRWIDEENALFEQLDNVAEEGGYSPSLAASLWFCDNAEGLITDNQREGENQACWREIWRVLKAHSAWLDSLLEADGA